MMQVELLATIAIIPQILSPTRRSTAPASLTSCTIACSEVTRSTGDDQSSGCIGDIFIPPSRRLIGSYRVSNRLIVRRPLPALCFGARGGISVDRTLSRREGLAAIAKKKSKTRPHAKRAVGMVRGGMQRCPRCRSGVPFLRGCDRLAFLVAKTWSRTNH